jgi:hypothetical protein
MAYPLSVNKRQVSGIPSSRLEGIVQRGYALPLQSEILVQAAMVLVNCRLGLQLGKIPQVEKVKESTFAPQGIFPAVFF